MLSRVEPKLQLTFDPIIRITKDAWEAAVTKEEHIRRTWGEIYNEVEATLNKLEALLEEIGPEDLKDYGVYGDRFQPSVEKLKAALRTISDQGINLGVETNSERAARIKVRAIRIGGEMVQEQKKEAEND